MKTIGSSPVAAVASAGEAAGAEASVPLSEVLESFWRAGPELGQLQGSPLASEFPDALLRQLGALMPGDAQSDLGDLLAPAYARLASAAERRALSE